MTFSRWPEAGAEEIAKSVAERLEFGLFGIEIVDRIARELGVQRRLLEGLDERGRSVIDRYVADAFRYGWVTESQYLRQLVRTVATLAEGGGVVILGRGSPFIVPKERALRVLVVAPTEIRAERLAREKKIPLERARESLGIADTERRDFVVDHFKVNPDDPSLYDVVVNSATLGREGAQALIGAAFERRFPGGKV